MSRRATTVPLRHFELVSDVSVTAAVPLKWEGMARQRLLSLMHNCHLSFNHSRTETMSQITQMIYYQVVCLIKQMLQWLEITIISCRSTLFQKPRH